MHHSLGYNPPFFFLIKYLEQYRVLVCNVCTKCLCILTVCKGSLTWHFHGIEARLALQATLPSNPSSVLLPAPDLLAPPYIGLEIWNGVCTDNR